MNNIIVYYLILIFVVQNFIKCEDYRVETEMSTESIVMKFLLTLKNHSDVNPIIKILKEGQEHDIEERVQRRRQAVLPTTTMLPSKHFRVGDFCNYDKQCEEFIDGSVACINNECSCMKGYNYNHQKNACYLQTIIGNGCNSDKDCLSVEYSYCKFGDRKEMNECTCRPGREANQAGDACERSSDEDQKCKNGKCRCSGQKLTMNENFGAIIGCLVLTVVCLQLHIKTLTLA